MLSPRSCFMPCMSLAARRTMNLTKSGQRMKAFLEGLVSWELLAFEPGLKECGHINRERQNVHNTDGKYFSEEGVRWNT